MSNERQTPEGIEIFSRKLKRPVFGADHRSRRSMLGAGGSSATTTPCAACKLLRRRCAQECPFSPYFAPHEPQKFACVHKVFGASNVSKMLMEVPKSQRADTVNSLVYEANVRLHDPVYGCMGIISALQQQAHSLQAELNAVQADILRLKSCEQTISGTCYVASTQSHDAGIGPSSTAEYAISLSSSNTIIREGAGFRYDLKQERLW